MSRRLSTGRPFAFTAIALMSLFLAGCGGLGEDVAANPAVPDPNAIAAADEDDVPVEPSGILASMAQPDRPNCPAVQVLDGTASYRGTGSAAGATGVTYQASLADVARECKNDGVNTTIKVGIRGRVLLGTAGRSGTYTVPIRVVVKEGDTVRYSNLSRATVTVPGSDTQAGFQHVESNIVVPQGPDGKDTYEILVGFDPTGAAPAKKKKKTS